MVSTEQFKKIKSGYFLYHKEYGVCVFGSFGIAGSIHSLCRDDVEAIKHPDFHEWEYCINGIELKSINIPFVDECYPKVIDGRDDEERLLAFIDCDGDYVAKKMKKETIVYLKPKYVKTIPTVDPKKEAIKNKIKDAKKALEEAEKELEELS